MAFRGAKNVSGTIIAIGTDEGQSGNYPIGSEGDDVIGTWCDWTFDEIPEFSAVDGAAETPMRFKENGTTDGIELRTDEEVLDTPQG